jgi:hypothetical protein
MPETKPGTTPKVSRCDEYRDLLELWVAWWNGPGRHGYRDPVIPPLARTADALACLACAGIRIEARCEACGRKPNA